MHDPKFLKLEGSWRGLNYLVHEHRDRHGAQAARAQHVQARAVHATSAKAVEFDQSQLFKKIYENEFGTPGGEPYGALIGDYEFTNHPDDIETAAADVQRRGRRRSPVHLGGRRRACSASTTGPSCPSRAISPRSSTRSSTPSGESFRDSEDSRFVTLVMPRVLARLPYGTNTKPIEEFDYEEAPVDARGKAQGDGPRTLLLDERGLRHGRAADRRLRQVPASARPSAAPRAAARSRTCRPTSSLATTATSTSSARPRSASPTAARSSCRKLGFLPLCHYKNTDYAVFFGGQTTQKPKKYDRPEATANAAISARLALHHGDQRGSPIT